MFRRVVIKSILLTAASLFAGALALGNAHAQSATNDEIVINVLPSGTSLLAVVALDQGFFKEQGLNVRLEKMRTPADGLASLIAGRSQVSNMNVGSIAQALLQGVGIRLINPMGYVTKDIGIYVRADSPLKSVADLKDKTVSLGQLQNNLHALVLKQIDDAGVPVDSVKFTLVPLGNAVATLRAGTVDASQIGEPFITDAGDTIRPLIQRLYGDRWLLGYWIVSEDFASKNPDTVKRITAAMAKATDYIKANPEEGRRATGSFANISGPNLEKMTVTEFDADPAVAQKSASEQLDLMVKYKIIPSVPDIDAAMFQ